MARLFTVASDGTLIDMIWAANQRLVIVAPGLSKSVAANVVRRIGEDGGPSDLSVTLDTDPEICRLGYVDIEALELLRPALKVINRELQTQSGLRIGLMVADEQVLVYSPTPLLIEAGSSSEEKPNAIRITGAGPAELASVCGASEPKLLEFSQEVGLNAVTEEAVSEARQDLESNPPRKFDLVRLERVFNYKLEFVEFAIEGYKLNALSVPIPPIVLGLGDKDLKDRFRNMFRVFESGVPFKFEIADPDDHSITLQVDEKWLTDEARGLRGLYFISLGASSYGNLIQKKNKAEFLTRLDRFRTVLTAYAELVRDNLKFKMQETRDSLVRSLLPRIQADPPREWKIKSLNVTLTPDEIRVRLEEEIDQAFGKVDQAFEPKVVCIFKGVQYETITEDAAFRDGLAKHFGEDGATQLLFEYDASRAEDPTPA